ncbi:MAG: hypothetical protein KAQ75_08560 [Bacteroidales bacterium]|nr:hypothetical protein [Bacteroidales bacterium]
MKIQSKKFCKISLVLFLTFICFNGISQQITDNDIVKSLLNKDYYNVNNTLDSLGVWYKLHVIRDFTENKQRIYSISDGKGCVKVYTLKLDLTKVHQITINFRHDSREQIEDVMRISGHSGSNVGKYSTDMIFTYKK